MNMNQRTLKLGSKTPSSVHRSRDHATTDVLGLENANGHWPASGYGSGFFVACVMRFACRAESSYRGRMPDGIGPGKGWDVFVDGAYRVSLDMHAVAISIAHNLQQRNKGSLIEVQDNATAAGAFPCYVKSRTARDSGSLFSTSMTTARHRNRYAAKKSLLGG